MGTIAHGAGQTSQQPTIPSRWLGAQITIEEAERRYPGHPDDPRIARFPEIGKPFGFLSEQWDKLKSQIQPGDELRVFAGPTSGGFALVRDGKVIAYITTYYI